MYESEVNDRIESADTLSPDILGRFAELRDDIVSRTILPWGEHCTECVWPTCYTTCTLYTPRTDGACRQFIDGMVRIDHAQGSSPYILKLKFKSWAKLWSVGTLQLVPTAEANRRERWNIAVGAVARNAPLPLIKPRVLRKVNYMRRQDASAPISETDGLPDAFLVECYNPNDYGVGITLTIRPAFQAGTGQFQAKVDAVPGYTRTLVAVPEIQRLVDLRQLVEVELVPNGRDETVLYFGMIDFVQQKSAVKKAAAGNGASAPARKWKCMVWDLDNTLWDGVLVESGASGLRIRKEAVDLIKEADAKGILQSIASKNHHDDAMAIVRSAGLEEYFLHPQIGWRPKSQAIADIAKSLNIGLSSIVFVDDQAFERAEVKAVHPEVDVVDAAECGAMSRRPEYDVPITAESRQRRSLYRQQELRDSAFEAAGGDYMSFLKSCDLRVQLRRLDDTNLRRAYELAQRTNQLNFSGNRYHEAELKAVVGSPSVEAYVIQCSDRFGDYGLIGLSIVDKEQPRLVDLMFSCRVQGKRVEHAVLSELVRRHRSQGLDFYANYRRTSKNAPAGRVFDEMGFESEGDLDGVSQMVFRASKDIPAERIVDVRFDDAAEKGAGPLTSSTAKPVGIS